MTAKIPPLASLAWGTNRVVSVREDCSLLCLLYFKTEVTSSRSVLPDPSRSLLTSPRVPVIKLDLGC